MATNDGGRVSLEAFRQMPAHDHHLASIYMTYNAPPAADAHLDRDKIVAKPMQLTADTHEQCTSNSSDGDHGLDLLMTETCTGRKQRA